MSASSTCDEPAGNGEDPPLQAGRGGLLEVVAGEPSDGSSEVVSEDGQGEPGGVGHELARWQVRETSGLELSDSLLDDRVPTVVGLHLEDVTGAGGDEGVVVPGREQRQLRPRR